MATPFGHALAGYAVSSFSKTAPDHGRPHLILLCVAMAVAPDLDLIPGLLQGKPVLYHGGVTHSLGFALVVSLGLAGLYKLRGRAFTGVLTLCFISYASHLVLDFFGPDGREPYGIPLFWPLSQASFLSPVPLLLGARHVGSTSAATLEFVKGVLSLYNVAALLLEAILILPFVFLGARYRHRKRQWSVEPGRDRFQDSLPERKI